MTRFLALLSAFLALPILAACPARAPVTDCTPNTTRCSPDGTQPQVCSASRRWQPTATEPCPEGTACCLVTSLDPGGQVHACAQSSACVEPLPGGQYAPPAPPPEATSTAGDWSPARSPDGHGVSAEVIPWHAFVP